MRICRETVTRRLAAFCFVLVVSCSILSVDEAKTRSFTTRSMLYEMVVTVEALPDAQYDLRVHVRDLHEHRSRE